MKKSITRLGCILVFAFVALATTCWRQGNVSLPLNKALAQGDSDGGDFVIWQKTLGVTATQRIRITVAKGNASEDLPFSYRGVFSDEAGFVVFRSPTQLVVGDFNSVDVSYHDLNMIAEPGTGRKQVLLQVIESRLGRKPSILFGALEIINEDGTTAAYDRFGDFL